MKHFALGLCLIYAVLLVGCARPAPPEPRVIQGPPVPFPVAVPCKPDLPPPPAYPDTDAKLKAAPTLFARVQALLAGRDIRSAENDKLRGALKGCAGG